MLRILAGMVLAVIPTWAAPAAREIHDAHRIAQALGAAQPDAHAVRAAAATLHWVTGVQPAPLSGRPAGEVTAGEARGEMMLASAVAFGQLDLADDVWAMLGVAPARAISGHRGWADGVGAAAGWLLGVHEAPPVPLPTRLPDGRVAGFDELYAALLARHHSPGPEQRAAARAAAHRAATRNAQLAELVASPQ